MPDYLATEKVEEESSLLEAGSALLKDLSTHRDSILSKAAIEKRNRSGKASCEVKSRVNQAQG